MSQSVIEGDRLYRGTVTLKAANLPANCVGDDQVSGSDPIQAEKLEQQVRASVAQDSGSAVASATKPLYVARGDGEILSIRAGTIVACAGAATITVDVRKNGTTVLTSVITLDNANTARVVEAGSIPSPAYVAGDWFDVVIVATAGGGTIGQGLLVDFAAREEAD